MKIWPWTLGVIAVLVLGGCSDDGHAGKDRPYQGAAHGVEDGGNKKTEIVQDGSHPQAELSTRMLFHVAGKAAGKHYSCTVIIDPANVGQRYEFPKDQGLLTMSLLINSKNVVVGNVKGFMEMKSKDTETTYGSMVVSLELGDSAGITQLEVDMTLSEAPR